jgi:TetR/AcrR family fatty acid metabolism transcriptional regulator
MNLELPIVVDESKASPDKYRRIINAAIKVFAQKGFFHAKVADVARAADVADGTIYLYFKNKDDLLISIFEHSMEHFIKRAHEELDKIPAPEERLRRFVELHLQTVREFPQLSQVLQIELRSSAKFMKEYKATRFLEYLDFLSRIILAGQELGAFAREIDVALIRRSIFGAIDELALEWVLSKNKRFELQEAGKHLANMILNGIKRTAA